MERWDLMVSRTKEAIWSPQRGVRWLPIMTPILDVTLLGPESDILDARVVKSLAVVIGVSAFDVSRPRLQTMLDVMRETSWHATSPDLYFLLLFTPSRVVASGAIGIHGYLKLEVGCCAASNESLASGEWSSKLAPYGAGNDTARLRRADTTHPPRPLFLNLDFNTR